MVKIFVLSGLLFIVNISMTTAQDFEGIERRLESLNTSIAMYKALLLETAQTFKDKDEHKPRDIRRLIKMANSVIEYSEAEVRLSPSNENYRKELLEKQREYENIFRSKPKDKSRTDTWSKRNSEAANIAFPRNFECVSNPIYPEGTCNDMPNVSHLSPIVFKQPIAFTCGKSIQWGDLQSWQGTWDTSICVNEENYIVCGKVCDTNAYKVSAEIYVPEASRSWPASGGKYKTVNPSDGGFVARFCIPKKGPNRQFRFQVYAKDRSPIGDACTIMVEE